MDAKDVIKSVTAKGYALIPRHDPVSSTESVAIRLGKVIDVSSLFKNVPKVQCLLPRKPSADLKNQYSGSYGTEPFPLHSDLAHWALPPRYLMLRCKFGVKDVETTLVPYSVISSAVSERTLKQALVVPRRKSKTQTICPLSTFFEHAGDWGFRWDFLFLSPLNEAARLTSEAIASLKWSCDDTISLNLLEPGDTLVIDNWRMLHGRSAVPDGSMNRVIERIYLSELGSED